MNNIVTSQDFKGRYNLALTDFGEPVFNDFITEEQLNLLINILGVELYNDFNTLPLASKWTSFKNGVTGYTDTDGEKRNWQGLKYLMIPYIYSKWIDFQNVAQSQLGTIKPKFENADPAQAVSRKRIEYDAWNEFVSRQKECYAYLWANESSFTDFDFYFKIDKRKDIITKGSIT